MLTTENSIECNIPSDDDGDNDVNNYDIAYSRRLLVSCSMHLMGSDLVRI